MTKEHTNSSGIQVAQQTLEAGKKFLPRIPFRKVEGGGRNDEEGMVRQAMAWHFHLALGLLESLFVLRGGYLSHPAGVLFRAFSEIVVRGVWIMWPGENRAGNRAERARSFFEYAMMKHDESERRVRFMRDFLTRNKRSEETVKAGLKEYREKENSKSDPKIRKEILRKYGENACTIPYRAMLKEIDAEGEHETVYPMASAATHGIPTKFDLLPNAAERQGIVADYISTAADRFYVLAHHAAAAHGIPEEEIQSVFAAAIRARAKKAKRAE